MRIISIKIFEPVDTIVIEKYIPDMKLICKGSRLFCGRCGNQLGTVTESIDLPFDSDFFLSKIDTETITFERVPPAQQLFHYTCKEAMFNKERNIFTYGWHFDPLDKFLLFQQKKRNPTEK